MLIKHPPRRPAQGFSLVELMVGSVIGLIVIGAVTALVLSMMRSNRQTLQSTRLNQELRATLAVIANDLKRARSVADPFTVATMAGGSPFEVVDVSTNQCLRFGYEVATSSGSAQVWRSFYLRNNRLVVSNASTSAGLTCSAAPNPPLVVELGSPQVNITGFSAIPRTPTDVTSRTENRYDLIVTGRLNDPDSELSGITRTMRQTVFIRSIGDGS